jgi:hypothetical protein
VLNSTTVNYDRVCVFCAGGKLTPSCLGGLIRRKAGRKALLTSGDDLCEQADTCGACELSTSTAPVSWVDGPLRSLALSPTAQLLRAPRDGVINKFGWMTASQKNAGKIEEGATPLVVVPDWCTAPVRIASVIDRRSAVAFRTA